MKKGFSLLLAAMMVFMVSCALAETVSADNTIEVATVENGTTLQFADHNFQITLPSDWLELEVSDDNAAAGIIYSCANPEGTHTLSIAYNELDTATDIDALVSELAASYEAVQTLTINGIPFVYYEILDYDVAGLATLNASGIGMYQFVFYPASDEDYGSLALQIAASIDTME